MASKEILAQRWIEDHGFFVHDANIIFRRNCPNMDLVVYGKYGAVYLQVKTSERPAGKDCVVIDGSPWTELQLYQGAPLFNKHEYLHASFVLLIEVTKEIGTHFYLAPPNELEQLVRERAKIFADKPKRDGSRRSIGFRKELPRDVLSHWLNNWQILGEPLPENNRPPAD